MYFRNMDTELAMTPEYLDNTESKQLLAKEITEVLKIFKTPRPHNFIV